MTFQLDDVTLIFIVGTVLPMATALVKQRFAKSAVGAWLLAALAALGAVLMEVIPSEPFNFDEVVVRFFVLFLTGVGMHFGLLKPAQVTGDNGAILQAAPKGIGSASQTGSTHG